LIIIHAYFMGFTFHKTKVILWFRILNPRQL
jgi:hypothetical protein